MLGGVPGAVPELMKAGEELLYLLSIVGHQCDNPPSVLLCERAGGQTQRLAVHRRHQLVAQPQCSDGEQVALVAGGDGVEHRGGT